MNLLAGWRSARAARRARYDTVLLALLASRPDGWGVVDLQRHVGGSFVAVYASLDRLQAAGRVRSWWQDGPYPRRRFYGAANPALPFADAERWLRTKRDGHRDGSERTGAWWVVDDLLDDLREHYQTGTPLAEPVERTEADR
jgi:hypothetical protein